MSNEHFYAETARIGKERLALLVERLNLVHGALPMTGLLTYRGRAPLSPLGYALLLPEFQKLGLGYRWSHNDDYNVPFGCMRYRATEKTYVGWLAASIFFGISIELAQHFFTASAYQIAWTGNRCTPVPVADIRARLLGYINAQPDKLFSPSNVYSSGKIVFGEQESEA